MATQVQPGALLAGAYEVERLLGEGGMGIVVAARHLEEGRTVALKFMLPMALSFPQAAERFIREAQVLSLLDSEHLAKVLDVGMLDNGAPYFAMEYVDGLDLGKLVRQYGALAITDAVDFVLQACRGMAQAHARGVVHRDLKPGNLLLAQRPDGSPLIKVLDFGLSKIMVVDCEEQAYSQTQTTGTMGTPAYMSPEQARSAKNAEPRSDLWSFGAILYHLLSGQLPFPAQATAEAFAKILYEEPAPLRDLAPWVPAALEAVILRCLQKDPERRYASLAELITALEPFSALGSEIPAQSGDAKVHHGPRKLDVSAVLQQRTMATFEPMSLALAGTMALAHVSLPPPPVRTKPRHRAALLGLLGGMLLVGGILVGAVLFSGHNATSAGTPHDRAPAPGAAHAPHDAGSRSEPDTENRAAATTPDAGEDTGARADVPVGPAVIEPPAPEVEPASATSERQHDQVPRARSRSGSKLRRTHSPPQQKKPPVSPDELDPFGTIH